MHRAPHLFARHTGAHGVGHGAVTEVGDVGLFGPHTGIRTTQVVLQALPEVGFPHDQAATRISTGRSRDSAMAIRSLTRARSSDNGICNA